MSKVFYIKETVLSFLLTFFFGVRVSGEPINLEYGVEQPVSTRQPDAPVGEWEWKQAFRVSSLHGVRQHVYLEG
jgi:hypothetical protein